MISRPYLLERAPATYDHTHAPMIASTLCGPRTLLGVKSESHRLSSACCAPARFPALN
jgi:hypothetical protein